MLNSPVDMAVQKGKSRQMGLMDFVTFGAGLLSAVNINLQGNLYLGEIILLALLPFLLYSRKALLRFGSAKVILFLGVGWLLNQIFTDLYRGTLSADILKGWALITFFLTSFLALFLLVFPNPRRLSLGLLGFVISLLAQQVFWPIGNMLVDAWKFGLGASVAIFITVIWIFLYSKKQNRFLWWNVFLFMVSIYSFYMRSRALGGITLLAAFVIWFRFTRFGRELARRINNPINITLIILLLFAAIGGIIQTYGYMAEQGYLGEVARNLYLAQSSGEYGILLGGRREWLPAMHAIVDSPFVGYGSYARNTDYGQFLYDLTSLGYVVNNNQIDAYLASRNTIPTHSHLLQGWVWAGLAGGVFWLFILVLIIRTMIMAYRYPNAFFMTTILLGFYAMWTVLFSPLSNIGRLQWAYVLVTFLYTLGFRPEPTSGNRQIFNN